jgi:nitroreductase/NAD-dependent dihydropyrimidine dehydrogenase PreA subunit
MTSLNVVEEKCKRDGICVKTCPMKIIEMKDKDAYPSMLEGADEFCIQCGHCVAVCPHGAMSHAVMTADQCPPIRKELMIDAAQAEQFLRMRRSIRKYKKRPVDRELLSRLVHIARYAPSGHNTQPVEWLVVSNPEEVHRLASVVVDWMRHLVSEASPLVEMMHLDRVIESFDAGVDRIFRSVPHLVITHAHQETRTAQSSSTIALAYMELMAPVLGLGACWAGYFMAASLFWPPLAQTLQLPKDHAVFGALMVGYPQFTYHRLPERREPAITWR